MTESTVSMVGSWESASGKPEVLWARDGDLNKAHRATDAKDTELWGRRIFRRQNEATAFAKEQGIRGGEGTTITCDIASGLVIFRVVGGKVITLPEGAS